MADVARVGMLPESELVAMLGREVID